MAIVAVNINNVESFRQAISTQHETVTECIETFNSAVTEIIEKLSEEKEKASLIHAELQSTKECLDLKMEEQQNKADELRFELDKLLSNEPLPEEELVVEPDEYDEEGNLVSVGDSYYEETSAHSMWRDEVSKAESDLQKEEKVLSKMQLVAEKRNNTYAKLTCQIEQIDKAAAQLMTVQEEVISNKNALESVSETAVEKLDKIIEVLNEYLSVSIGSISSSGGTQSFWSKIVYPGVTVSGMSVEKFSVSRVPTMSKAFDGAPQWIKKEVAGYGNDVNVKDKPCRSHYTPSEKQIYMDPRYDDDEYAEVFKHEFGHYIDHAHRWISQSPAFIEAYRLDCEKYDLSTESGVRNTTSMMQELMDGESAKYDRCVSDILSATSYNDRLVIDAYYMEGLSFYQHDNEYWSYKKNRENEVFANLFAIYSNNDEETIRFISKNFPNTDKVFKNLLR